MRVRYWLWFTPAAFSLVAAIVLTILYGVSPATWVFLVVGAALALPRLWLVLYLRRVRSEAEQAEALNP